MHISYIMVRDWKSFIKASFEFPNPAVDANIVLIGAPNGYGKTSLFEALVLCMFGREGLPLIARSPFSGDDERLATSYKAFLEKALHRGATDAGRYSCSVSIRFVREHGERLEIRRIWHFSDTGVYRPQDEEVHIYSGVERQAVGPSGLTGNDRLEWFRDYIANEILPFTLAHFFMFDGEQVSVLAEREMSAQVRTGIEGLLGIPVLKQLAKDLRTYASARRRESPNISNETIERLEHERDKLTKERDNKANRLIKVEVALARLKGRREKLIRELASVGAGSQALLQEQFEKIKDYERSIDLNRAKLEDLLVKDIALSLCGIELRTKLRQRLEAEAVRGGWEAGKNHGDINLERFLTTIKVRLTSVYPNLTDNQRAAILEATRYAWEEVWYPPPDNCAQYFRHPFLNEHERGTVIAKLEELNQLGATEISELLNTISANEAELRRVQEEVTRTEAVAPHVDSKRKDLRRLNGKIENKHQKKGTLRREIKSLEGQIIQKNVELAKMAGQWDAAKPAVRRAARALKVSSMVDEIVTRAVPSQINAIAEAMTMAHKSMAHKKDLVERIDINEDCNVKLLNADKVDVRAYDLSAGEKQIFTQSLISAVSSVSGRMFPMLIDTPLGRLDIEHRKGVLRHLASRETQVILLSTNTEVVGEYLREIEPHVQKKYVLQFDRIGEIGQSAARVGYFDER